MDVGNTLGNHLKLKLTDENDNNIDAEKMRNALISIASEIQRYQESSVETESLDATQQNMDEKLLFELLKCKSKIKSKRGRIYALTRNLKTACFVAKTIASAKEEESGTLKKRLNVTRSECDDLLEKNRSNIGIINSLSRENEKLQSRIDSVANFIELGYKELQKIKCEAAEETSVLSQLRALILCCGQYYADYRNENEKYLHIKQRNRFLENKVHILENQIEAISEQLRTLQYCKDRLQKENSFIRDRRFNCYNTFNNTHVEYSTEILMETRVSEESPDYSLSQQYIDRKRDSGDCTLKDLDLSSHLLLVRNLLIDQDTLLEDLKIISREFNVVE